MVIIPGTGIISEYRKIVSKLPVVLLTHWVLKFIISCLMSSKT
nr:unnamed protein product [Callosobruchus analis]